MSQATVSRLIKAAGDQVLAIGRGPRARYARADDLFTSLPLLRIDRLGVPEHLADVRPLRGEEFHVVAHRDERWLSGVGGDGLYDDLPYFLDDLRPQGFIGRAIAGSLGAPYPADPRRWTARQVLNRLTERGTDLPGDLVLGRQTLVAMRPPRAISTDDDLVRLADESMAGETPGSSAGGEQPKILVARESSQSLVKFSGRGGGKEARRWRDILIAEHHALTILSEHGIDAAGSSLIESGCRTFLEIRRFDREGELGRLPMVSRAAVDAEFSGFASGWTATMRRLRDAGLVSSEDALRAAWLELFGHWIGNTDMHLGNLSLRPTASGFDLLPVYDMTAMRWAPIRCDLPPTESISPPTRDPRLESQWQETACVALEYWRRLAAEPRLGDEFRDIADVCAATIASVVG